MAKVVVMVDEIIKMTLALVMTVDVWPKEKAAQAGHVKRPHLYKLGTVALWEIHHYQKPVEHQTYQTFTM